MFWLRIKKAASSLIPNAALRRQLRRKYTDMMRARMIHKKVGSNEIIYPSYFRRSIKISIKGNNNIIYVGKGLSVHGAAKLQLLVNGNNNKITIGESAYINGGGLTIMIGEPAGRPVTHDASVTIGNKCDFNGAHIFCIHSHSSVTIGEHCMFSFGILIRHSDAHPIYKLGTKNIINHVDSLAIGNHVWIGYNAHILKNVHIADGCIVGCNAVVAKSCSEQHCAIAGNPARIVRRQIDWESIQTDLYIHNGRGE